MGGCQRWEFQEGVTGAMCVRLSIGSGDDEVERLETLLDLAEEPRRSGVSSNQED